MYLKMMHTLNFINTEKYNDLVGNLHLFIHLNALSWKLKYFLIVLPSLAFRCSFT